MRVRFPLQGRLHCILLLVFKPVVLYIKINNEFFLPAALKAKVTDKEEPIDKDAEKRSEKMEKKEKVSDESESEKHDVDVKKKDDKGAKLPKEEKEEREEKEEKKGREEKEGDEEKQGKEEKEGDEEQELEEKKPKPSITKANLDDDDLSKEKKIPSSSLKVTTKIPDAIKSDENKSQSEGELKPANQSSSAKSKENAEQQNPKDVEDDEQKAAEEEENEEQKNEDEDKAGEDDDSESKVKNEDVVKEEEEKEDDESEEDVDNKEKVQRIMDLRRDEGIPMVPRPRDSSRVEREDAKMTDEGRFQSPDETSKFHKDMVSIMYVGL